MAGSCWIEMQGGRYAIQQRFLKTFSGRLVWCLAFFRSACIAAVVVVCSVFLAMRVAGRVRSRRAMVKQHAHAG
ncbi:hypothetical protein BDQ12DRAFT_236769 [Crucibulum laeve]|uniref:Uncharacterized protein n=1 Tax=Crucibulum laeve TaxID=68775 RepID=A0A5C3LUL7_9AGAR|nr:hypothetical protein BDQ12DRAFT_236769 [Crucibulum laeve]